MATDRGEYQTPQQQFEQVKEYVRAQIRALQGEKLVAEVLDIAARADEVKARVAHEIKTKEHLPESFGGDERDHDSMKSKAVDTKVAVQKVLIAIQIGTKLPLAKRGGMPFNDTISTNSFTILQSLSTQLDGGKKVSEQTSPYVYEFINKVLNGHVSKTEDLISEFQLFKPLEVASKEIFTLIQEATVESIEKIGGVTREQALESLGAVTSEKQKEAEEQQDTFKKLESSVLSHEKEFGDMLIRIRTSEKIKAAQAEQLVQLLIHSSESPSSEYLISSLEPIGFETKEIESISIYSQEYKVYAKIKERQNSYGYLERYGLLTPELKSTFNISSMQLYLEPDDENPGTYKMTDKAKRLLKRKALSTLNKLMEHVDDSPDIDFNQSFSDLREGQAFFELQQLIGEFQTEVKTNSQLTAMMGTKNMEDLSDYIQNGVIQELTRERSLRELFHTMGIYIKQLPPNKYGEFMSRYNLSDIDSIVTSDFSGKIVSLAMSEYERYILFDRMKNRGETRTSLFAGKSHLDMMYKANDDRARLNMRLKNTLRNLKLHIEGKDAEEGVDPRFTDAVAASIKQISEKNPNGYGMQRWDIENISEFEDWELQRALKYAQGIHLTQTIRGFENIASGRPPTHFRGSSDNMVDMAGVLNPTWKWMMGRGGSQLMSQYKEALSADMIKKRPEKNLGRRIWADLFGQDRWDPEGVHQKYASGWNTDELKMEKWAEIEDQWLYKDINFQKMLKLLGLGGLAGRGGWRFEGFRAGVDADGSEYERYVAGIQDAILEANTEINGKSPAEFGANQAVYDQLAKSVGVGSRFFFDQARADAFAREELWKYLTAKGGFDKENLTASELDKLWKQYTTGIHGNDDIMTLPGGEKMTLIEIDEVKLLTLRGLNFRDLMKRSPMDFLNSLINISPELLTEGLGGLPDEYFIFNEEALEQTIQNKKDEKGNLVYSTPGARKGILIKIKAKQADMRRMWGTDKKENQDHLLKIRSFYKRFEQWGEKRLRDAKRLGATEKLDYKRHKSFIDTIVWEKMYSAMDVAIEKVKLRNAAEMAPEDVLVMNDGVIDKEATAELRTLFFGEGDTDENGLVTYFKNLNEQCGVGADGKEIPLSQWTEKDRGFFYHMGRSWYNELGNNFPPDTSDVDWRYILHNMGANSGENMVKRLWGDLNSYNETVSKLMGLDGVLATCAASGSLEKMMEIHTAIRGLKGIAGDDAVYEMQYYLAQVVARYFQENSATRIPILGMIGRLGGGNTISLSKIYGGVKAMTMSTDAINAYFQSLANMDCIAKEGIYGVERLQQALGADWEKMLLTEVIPNTSTVVILFLLYKYLKDAADEAAGKKKK